MYRVETYMDRCRVGTMPLGIMLLSIMTLSIKGFLVILNINDTEHDTLPLYRVSLCLVSHFFIVMLSVIMLSVIMLSVIMLSVVAPVGKVSCHMAGNTKGGSITVPLTSCLTGSESAV